MGFKTVYNIFIHLSIKYTEVYYLFLIEKDEKY